MKFSPLLILPLFLLSSAAFAQRADQIKEHPSTVMHASPPVITDETTREMSNRLHLNEGQYLKLNAVNRAHTTRVAQIKEQYRTDATTRLVKLAELETQYQQDYRQILTPDQLSLINEEPVPATGASGNGRG